MPTAPYTVDMLNLPVDIEQQVETYDLRGGVHQTWTRYVRVRVRDKTSAISVVAAGETLITAIRHSLVMRYYPGITTKMRVNLGDGYLSIQGVVDPDDKHMWLELTCAEVAL